MISVYIHIPFCKKICSYCDFCKIIYQDKYIDRYLDNLEKEINERYLDEEIKSIYIGGGTPSILPIDKLERLLKIITKFNLVNDYEYTIECNISDISHEKLKLFKKYHLNRISIGVESFNYDYLKILGRDDENNSYDNVLLAKKYFDNINIDLIYGVDNNKEIIKKDIEKFLELDIPHISYYSLIIEDNTKLKINNYKYIDQDIDYEMFSYINNILSNHGYTHYEISNYAKEGYQSIHNINYWLNGSYYGFGLGSVSYLNNYRFYNTKNLTKYLNGYYIDRYEYESSKTNKENDLILGLRMIKGINIDTYNKKYSDNLLDKEIIHKLINDKYLEIDNNYLRCNYQYIYLLNNILEKILGSDL